MINNFIFSRSSKNWIRAFSLCSILTLGTSCSDNEEIVTDSKEIFSASAKLNTVFQAENYDSEEGIQKSNNNTAVGYIQDGDWIKFDDFDHSGATSITVRASSGSSGGTIQFRKGSSTGGNLLAEVEVSGTGGWTNFQEFTADITGSSSNSDLYIVFTGGSGYLLDIDSFEFNNSSDENNSGSNINLALDGTAEQSSESHEGAPGRAIDGNTNGRYSSGSVMHTASENQPWWQVRLDNDTNIEEIVIWNRTDNCCITRLSNFDVFVYNSSGSLVFKKTIVDAPRPNEVINTGGVTGNRVRIKLKGDNQSLQLAEVQVFGQGSGEPVEEEEPVEEVEPIGGTETHPTGNDPWDFFHNCDQWKITWVDGSEDKNLCERDERSGQYEIDGDALVFTVDLNGDLGSTSSSDYPRSELREREEDGGSDIYWTTSGDHALYIDQAIMQKPNGKDHVVAGQIHGNKEEGIDDSMVVRLEGSKLMLSFNGGKLRDDLTITDSYSIGQRFEVILRIINGKHYCYYKTGGGLKTAYNNGSANSYRVQDGSNTVLLDIDYDQTYFKVGNYCQSNEEKEREEGTWGSSNNKSIVKVWGFDVNHEGGDFR